MTISETLLPEYDQEIATTRAILERVPEADGAWRPHAKSKPLGELAVHVASIPWWLETLLATTELDVAATPPPAPFSGRADLLARFERNAAAGRAGLSKATDADFAVPWTLRMGERVFFSMPRAAVVRPFCFSHLIHHRAQLGVYLRLRDVPLPPSYGPTADTEA